MSHQGNFTNPHYSFPLHDHSFIHSHALIHTFIHSLIHSSIHLSKHCICNCCITTLHITSRSGSRLIRYERQSIEVRRPAHEGLEATSGQTEPGEKNRDEPQWPCPTPLRSGQGHLNLSCSILTPRQTQRISVEESVTPQVFGLHICTAFHGHEHHSFIHKLISHETCF